ncbi:uncharacterized protein [Ptychodera flava]|uniref:uncharacterized protein n=1 Tax=Ptychodera flava TaxID=63121 RepID=UPI003969F9C7
MITTERTEHATRGQKRTTKVQYTNATKTKGQTHNIPTIGPLDPATNDQKDTTKPHYSQVNLTQGQENNFVTQARTEPATRSPKSTIKQHYNQVTTTQGQDYNIINRGYEDHVTHDKQSTMKQWQDNRISGDLDYIENHLPLVIGVSVFLVFLTIVNAVICSVCHRRRTRSINKRSVHYDNLDIGTERTNNLAMFLSPDDYEMVDVTTQLTTFLASDKQNDDEEGNRDEGHRNKNIPENTQVNKTREKKTKEVTNQEYSQITANYETINDNSHNALREDVHYYTVMEADDKQTAFTGNRSLSGQMYSGEGYSSSAGGAGEQAEYNVVDRTGKSYKAATDNNEVNNYEEIDITKEDVSTNEDTIYNKLNFGARRLHYIKKSDYS